MADAEPPIDRVSERRLSVAVASVGFGQSALLALVPVASERTSLDATAMGALAFIGAIIFLVSAPLWGRRGARWRLRTLFLILTALMILGHGLFALALSLDQLSAGAALLLLGLSRTAYAVGAAGVVPHAQAALVLRTPLLARATALGRLSAGLSVGRILGSGIMLDGGSGRVAPLLLLVASPLLLLAAPDLAPRQASAQSPGRSPVRAILPLLGIGFAVTFGLGQIQIVLGLLLRDRFGLDASTAAALAGWTFACVAVAMIAAQILLVPRLGSSLGRNLRLGLAGFTLGAAVIALAGSPLAVTLGAVIAGTGIAVATPTYTASLSARVPPDRQASGAGWLASTHVLGQGTGAFCGGATFSLSAALPFWTAAALGCALIGLSYALTENITDQAADP